MENEFLECMVPTEWEPIDREHHYIRFSSDTLHVGCNLLENNMFNPEKPFSVVHTFGKGPREHAIYEFDNLLDAQQQYSRIADIVRAQIRDML